MMCKIICYSKYLSHAQKQSEKKYDKLEIAFLTQNAEAVIAISLVWIRHFVSYDVMKSKYGGTRRWAAASLESYEISALEVLKY